MPLYCIIEVGVSITNYRAESETKKIVFVAIGDFLNTQDIIFVITKTIDILVVLIIGISALQAIISAITSVIKIKKKENNIAIKSFISSLLLALELESANAILKMGLFASNAINTDNLESSNTNNLCSL